MLLEPDYPLETKFWDLPANQTTLTAYVPLKIDALSNNARSASLEVETIQETLKALQERMKSSERREQEAKEEREKEKQDSERRELERKEERKRAKKERKEENRKQRRELEASERRHSEKQEKSEKRINALEDQLKEAQSQSSTFQLQLEESQSQSSAFKLQLEEVQSQSSAFKLQLEEVQSQSNDTASYIAVGDLKALYRIRVRKLLDLGQAKLARAAGLASDTSKNGSLKWRDALPKGGAENRLQSAVNHLKSPGQIDQATRDVMISLGAMRLMTEMSSYIRVAGDTVAHEMEERAVFEEAVGWHDVVEA